MAVSQKLPGNGSKWEGSIHKFNENFIKNYDEDSNKGYFLEVDVEYPKNLLILKKVYKVIQFNQEAWLKLYIHLNTKLRTEAKNDFEQDFFNLMNNTVFGKTMENVIKHRDIKLVTTDKRRNQLSSEPNYHTTKYFSESLINRNEKNKSKNE